MSILRTTIAVTAVLSATAGGVFFAFSTFVMSGLGRVPASHGISAMQAINVTAVRPPFMLLLFGTAAMMVGLGIWALPNMGSTEGKLVLAAALIYFFGVIVLTIAFNVPKNDALAKLDATSPESVAMWKQYLVEWTRANHIRTLSGCLSALLLALALRAGQ